MATKKPVIVQDPEKPVEVSILAKAIVDLSSAAKRLSQSGLNRKAVIVLLAHSSGLGHGTVKLVLDHMEYLQQTYLDRK